MLNCPNYAENYASMCTGLHIMLPHYHWEKQQTISITTISTIYRFVFVAMFHLFPMAIFHVDEESEIYYTPDGQFVHDKI